MHVNLAFPPVPRRRRRSRRKRKKIARFLTATRFKDTRPPVVSVARLQRNSKQQSTPLPTQTHVTKKKKKQNCVSRDL